MGSSPGKLAARALVWNSYSIAVLFGTYALVVIGFKFGVITDSPSPQRVAAVLKLVTYWTSIGIFGGCSILLAFARAFQLRYVASFAASIPPMYQLWIYTVYPLANPPLTINWIGSILWAWLLPMLVLLVHWEHEKLSYDATGHWTYHYRQESG